MCRNSRILLAILIALFILVPAAAYAQNPFEQQARPPQQTQRAQQPSSEAQMHFGKAIQFMKENKTDAAIAELQIVKKLMPKQAAVLVNLGMCYMQKQNLPNAESAFRQALALDPKNSYAQVQMTRVLMARGKDAEALASAKRSVKANPKDAGAQFMLGVIYLKMKNLASAAAAFKSTLAIKPKDTGSLYNLGYCQVNLKKYADARKTFAQFFKLVPDDPQAHVLAGVACEQSGDKAGAIAHYDKAAWKNAPASPTAIQGLVRVYGTMGKTDKCIEILKRGAALYKGDYSMNLALGRMLYAQGKYPAAEPYLLAAKKARSDAFVNTMLALNYTSQRKFKEAETCALAALKLDPKGKQTMEVYTFVMENQRKTDQAVAQYRKWEQYYPQDSLPNTRIGDLYLMVGKSDLAFKDYEKAMKKKPKDAGLMVSTAASLKAMGKFDDAVKLLQKAITADPKSEPAFLTLAGVYEAQKQTDPAIEQYKKVLVLNPKSTAALQSLAAAYDSKKDYMSEIDAYRKLLVADPKDTRAAMSIPMLYDKAGQLDTAIAEGKKLVDANPSDTNMRVQYGELLGKKKDWTGAIAVYAELIKSKDVSTKAYGYYLTGGAQESMEKPDDAIESYKKCLDAMPGTVLALDALAKIYEGRKKSDEFYAYLKSVVESGKDGLPYAYFTKTFKDAGKSAEALTTMEQLAQKSPDSVLITFSLAGAYADAGANDKAVEIYKKLLAKDSKLIRAQRGLGDVYVAMGRNEEAAACFAEVLKAMPFDAALQRQLGDIYVKLGKKDQAMVSYKEALKQNPDDKEASDKLKSLESPQPAEKAPEPPKPAEPVPAPAPVPANK